MQNIKILMKLFCLHQSCKHLNGIQLYLYALIIVFLLWKSSCYEVNDGIQYDQYNGFNFDKSFYWISLNDFTCHNCIYLQCYFMKDFIMIKSFEIIDGAQSCKCPALAFYFDCTFRPYGIFEKFLKFAPFNSSCCSDEICEMV